MQIVRLGCCQSPGVQQLRPEPDPEGLFTGHAVVADKAQGGKGCSDQDAQPGDSLRPHLAAQSKIHAHRRQNCHSRPHALPHGHAEKDSLVVFPDIFVDFYFQMKASLGQQKTPPGEAAFFAMYHLDFYRIRKP